MTYLLILWSQNGGLTKSMLTKSGSQSCPVVMKIAGFNEKNNNQVCWYGDFFYSHNKGYKMYLYMLMLLLMVKVKVLTCQCTCTS